jgi:peptidoglycan/LPS O-acetylase OafA/YrhL
MTSRSWAAARTPWALAADLKVLCQAPLLGQCAKLETDLGMHLLRAALTLYVIAYLHLGGYLGNGSEHVASWTPILTAIAMAAFTFMSGFLVGQSRPLGWREVRGFALNRLRRIYPLYLLALAGFVLLWLTDPLSAAKAALGASMFWPEAPMTLWYVAMLVVFYALTPLLAWTDLKLAAAVAFAFWSAYVGVSWFGVQLDERVITQFPAFVAGVFARRLDWRYLERRSITALALAMPVALGAAWPYLNDRSLNAILLVPCAVIGPFLLLAAFDRLSTMTRGRIFWLWFSQISFAAYLLHRIVFELLIRIYWPAADLLSQLLWLVCGGLPAIALSAHLADKGQSWALRWLLDRRGQ